MNAFSWSLLILMPVRAHEWQNHRHSAGFDAVVFFIDLLKLFPVRKHTSAAYELQPTVCLFAFFQTNMIARYGIGGPEARLPSAGFLL